jgi:hypothetical protein
VWAAAVVYRAANLNLCPAAWFWIDDVDGALSVVSWERKKDHWLTQHRMVKGGATDRPTDRPSPVSFFLLLSFFNSYS